MARRARPRWLLGLLLLAAPALAQDPGEPKPEAPTELDQNLFTFEPIELDAKRRKQRLVITLHRWLPLERTQGFRVLIESKPSFVTQASLEGGDRLSFAPDDEQKDIILGFELDEDRGGSGDLVVVIRAEDEALVPRERRYVLPLRLPEPPAPGEIQVFALRADVPGDVTYETLHEHIDREATPLTVFDRLAIFFTPPPAEEFYWALHLPDGESIAWGLFTDSKDRYEYGAKIGAAGKDAPGRFVFVKKIFGSMLLKGGMPSPGTLMDPEKADKLFLRDAAAGRYVLRTAPETWGGEGLLGMTNRQPGDYVETGGFELTVPRLAYKGFLPDSRSEIPLKSSGPHGEGRMDGKWRESQGRADIDVRALWARGREQARSRFVVSFPPEIDLRPRITPIPVELASAKHGFTTDRRFKQYFLGAVRALVPHRDGPPDPHKAKTYGIHGDAVQKAHQRLDTKFKYAGWLPNPNFKGEVELQPKAPADLGHLLRDAEVRWYVPVGIELVEERDHRVAGRFFGFAVYGRDLGPPLRLKAEPVTPLEPAEEPEDTPPTETVPPAPPLIPSQNPRLAALIREWISKAEPPPNGLVGAKLRWNEWAQAVGRTPTGVIEARGKPDDVGGRSSEDYLWSKRKLLDSVDHCTLEEYVRAKLDGKGHEHCRARYKRQARIGVPQLRRKRRDEAARVLTRSGLRAKFTKGRQEPSPGLAGQVDSQNPAPDDKVKPGTTVTASIFQPNPRLDSSVPRVKGLSAAEAEQVLRDAGLTPRVREGRAPPTPDMAGKVYAQQPPPGNFRGKGRPVDLTVYTGGRRPTPKPKPKPEPRPKPEPAPPMPELKTRGTTSFPIIGYCGGYIYIQGHQRGGRPMRIETDGGKVWYGWFSGSRAQFTVPHTESMPSRAKVTFRNYGRDVTLPVELKQAKPYRTQPHNEHQKKAAEANLKRIRASKESEYDKLYLLAQAHYRLSRAYAPSGFLRDFEIWLATFESYVDTIERAIEAMKTPHWKGFALGGLWIADQNAYQLRNTPRGAEMAANRREAVRGGYIYWLHLGIKHAERHGRLDLARGWVARQEAQLRHVRSKAERRNGLMNTLNSWKLIANLHFHLTGDLEEATKLFERSNVLGAEWARIQGKPAGRREFGIKPDPKFDPNARPPGR